MDIVESQPENIVEEEQFLFIATVLYVKMVAVLASSYKREERDQSHYAEHQVATVLRDNIEIFDWMKRLVQNNVCLESISDYRHFISFA